MPWLDWRMTPRDWWHLLLMLLGAADTGIAVKLIPLIVADPRLYPSPCLVDAVAILLLGVYTLLHYGYLVCTVEVEEAVEMVEP